MNSKYPQPEPTRIISDLEALKTIADPLRKQIMEALMPNPLTVGQLAELLGVENSKLYYHMNTLEKYGFVQVVNTTQRGNLIEKYYWVTAYNFELEKDVINFNVDTPEGTEALSTLLLSKLDATREDLARSLQARHRQIAQGVQPNPRPVMDYREIFTISDEKAIEFQERLHALMKEFEEENTLEKGTEQQSWALGIFMYPRFYYPPVPEDDQSTQKDGNDRELPPP